MFSLNLNFILEGSERYLQEPCVLFCSIPLIHMIKIAQKKPMICCVLSNYIK
jgi:hypothetical protein